MRDESFEFLKQIEETPSVSGFEQPVARIVRKRMNAFADEITTDVHGNAIAILNPGGSPRVMLAGHMDQIGMMIRHVTDEGYLHVSMVGGIDPAVLPGSRVTIHTRNGPVDGVIGRKPAHMIKKEDRGNLKLEISDIWIDIGAKNRAAALERVSMADPITYKLGLSRLGEDLVVSPGLDNKVGTFVVMEALRIASKAKIKCALYAVATVQEEIGLRGARTATYGIDPAVGIAVDVTHATDNPGAEKKIAGECDLGKGPTIDLGPNINSVLSDLFIDTARKNKIPYQIGVEPGATGTDANEIQITRAGVATGLIGLPNRYMHSQVEVCSLSDLENAAELIAATIARIDSKTSFIPM